MSLGSLPENKQDLNTVLNVKMKVFTVFFLHIRSLLRVYSYLQPTVIILIVKVTIKHSDCHKSDDNFVVFFSLIFIFYSPIRIGKRNNVPLESV